MVGWRPIRDQGIVEVQASGFSAIRLTRYVRYNFELRIVARGIQGLRTIKRALYVSYELPATS